MFPVKTIGEAAATDRKISVRALGDDSDRQSWHVPEETPVAFVYNRRNYAVMLATPQDIVDYVVGFSLTERIVDSIEGITGVVIAHTDLGIDLRIRITEKYLQRFDVRQRRRNMPGYAGCGLCGLENADSFLAKLPKVAQQRVSLNADIISKSLDAISQYQTINRRTHSVHGAAWVSHDGEIVSLREDVGRHNAMDKLLGALALRDIDTDNGFVVVSSRCSYEIIEKAARRGIKALVSISGPTNFALRKAKEANISLYARGSSGVVEVTR